MEDEVFHACTKAVNEIAELIQRISTSANTYRFIVTSDSRNRIYGKPAIHQFPEIICKL